MIPFPTFTKSQVNAAILLAEGAYLWKNTPNTELIALIERDFITRLKDITDDKDVLESKIE